MHVAWQTPIPPGAYRPPHERLSCREPDLDPHLRRVRAPDAMPSLASPGVCPAVLSRGHRALRPHHGRRPLPRPGRIQWHGVSPPVEIHAGEPPAYVMISAVRLGEPPCSRYGGFVGTSGRASGLASGRWRIRASCEYDDRRYEGTIELEGNKEVERTIGGPWEAGSPHGSARLDGRRAGAEDVEGRSPHQSSSARWQQRLYLRPEPHGHGSLRPILGAARFS